LHGGLAVDQHRQGMVDHQFVQERGLLVGAELDIGPLVAPVPPELVGRGPRHERVVAVAVDEDRSVGLVLAELLHVEQRLEGLFLDQHVDVLGEVRLQMPEHEVDDGLTDALP